MCKEIKDSYPWTSFAFDVEQVTFFIEIFV